MPHDLAHTALLVIDLQVGLDATYTFDMPAHGRGTLTANELATVTATNLQDETADVVMTADLV